MRPATIIFLLLTVLVSQTALAEPSAIEQATPIAEPAANEKATPTTEPAATEEQVTLTTEPSAIEQVTPINETSGRGIACWPKAPNDFDFGAALDEPIELTSGDANIEADGTASFSGPIEMSSSQRVLTAGEGSYDAKTGIVDGRGGFKYQDPINKFTGDSVQYNAFTGEFEFDDPTFELLDVKARGEAKSIKLVEPGVIELRRVRYTSCPEGRDDWLLRARTLKIDTNTGMGTATGASLSFKGVPFFYFPYFTYPVTDDRRSGLLFPSFGSSDNSGLEYSQPIYWNIKPNMDATFVPRYLQDRGIQMGTEYRFLTQNNAGDLWGDYLSDDDETGEDRWRYEIETETYLPFNWRGQIDATGVSDQDYFEDLSTSIGQTSQVALSRAGILEYYDTTWSASIKVQDYQTIDPFLSDDDDPYFQAPNVRLGGMWYDGWLGTDFGFSSESTYFTRDDSIKGLRTNVRPTISRPFRRGGLYMVPEAQFDYTVYNLNDEPADQSSSPDRAAPILTLDTGAIFERLSGKDQQRIVTFEPRALYTYIPERNQDDIPVFDTILADFNLIQLFKPNRYIGYDRLGDANQVAAGLTSRVIDTETGQELLIATIGQERMLESSEVLLPGEEPNSSRKSNYIAELGVRLSPLWRADGRYQYNADDGASEQTTLRLRFKPGKNKALNLGYRYTRDRLEQTDFSFAWPLGRFWSAIGRYNYSIEDNEVLDEYLGVEYSSCCWGIQVVGRRSVQRSSGDQNQSIAVQFVMKGLGGFGNASTGNLQRDILTD